MRLVRIGERKWNCAPLTVTVHFDGFGNMYIGIGTSLLINV